MGWEVGEAPACASNTVDAAKLPVGVDEGNPPGSGDRKKTENVPVSDRFKSIKPSTPFSYHVF